VLRPDDRCAVFAIQSVPRRTLALTVGPAAAGKALGSIRAAGDTALYDSVASAIRELKGEKARRAIVVLSDGEDTASVNSFDDLVKDATGAGIPVYFIAFSGDSRTTIGFDKMRYLVSQTGGFLASAIDKSLPETYRLIEKDLREQYAIRYQVSDLSKPNEWRRVRVVLKSPQLTARTITGYYTP
jgi:VWFA-related protein